MISRDGIFQHAQLLQWRDGLQGIQVWGEGGGQWDCPGSPLLPCSLVFLAANLLFGEQAAGASFDLCGCVTVRRQQPHRRTVCQAGLCWKHFAYVDLLIPATSNQ